MLNPFNSTHCVMQSYRFHCVCCGVRSQCVMPSCVLCCVYAGVQSLGEVIIYQWSYSVQQYTPSPVILLNYTLYFLAHAVLCNTQKSLKKKICPTISNNNKSKGKRASDCRLVHLRAGTSHYRKKEKLPEHTVTFNSFNVMQPDVMTQHRCLPQNQQRSVTWMATLNSPSSRNYQSFIGAAWSVRHSFSWEGPEEGKGGGASERIHRCLRLHARLRVTNQRYH